MTVYLNGQPLAGSPLLPAALYGQGVYTSFRVTAGRVKGLGLHLQRLQRDAAVILGTTPALQDLRSNLQQALAGHTGAADLRMRYTLAPAAVTLARPAPASLLHLVAVEEYAPPPAAPLTLQTLPVRRSLAQHKMSSHLALHLWARRQAQGLGFADALFVEDGVISEGPTWNILFVAGEQLVMTASTTTVLPGITQQLLQQAAAAHGIPILPKSMTLPLPATLQAAVLTNAVTGLRPVAAIDDKALQTDHPLLQKLQTLYADLQGEAIS